jgi:hypothetical protein
MFGDLRPARAARRRYVLYDQPQRLLGAARLARAGSCRAPSVPATDLAAEDPAAIVLRGKGLLSKQLFYWQIEELAQFLPEFRRRRGDAVGCVHEMAICDAGLVGDQSEVPVSPPDDGTDGLIAEPSVLTGHG